MAPAPRQGVDRRHPTDGISTQGDVSRMAVPELLSNMDMV
jgi:hypothetical protein